MIRNNDNTPVSEQGVWILTDSESSIERLQQGPGAQVDALADEVWELLANISKNRKIALQWIPGHRDIDGNERADQLAKEGASLNQGGITLDFMTVKAAVKLHVRKK